MNSERVRYTVSNITQNEKRFYSLSIPSDILSKCCFVSRRDENPLDGFQRALDYKRAQEIADYIDNENGTIPSSIILSAQEVADVKIVGSGRTIEFTVDPRAFLILDGQHRVYGFSLSKHKLRVPVVIYNKLSRKEETRLFIIINSKQKGVTTELLLDIKKMADYESTTEELLSNIYNLFYKEPNSALYGKLSPSDKTRGKISRVTFNNAMIPVTKFFINREPEELYEILNCYLYAIKFGFFEKNKIEEKLYSHIVFKAWISLFPDVASKLKDRHGPEYNTDNYHEVMSDMFARLNINRFKKPGSSYKLLSDYLIKQLKESFTL